MDRAPTVAFSVDGVPSSEVARALARVNIGVGHRNFHAYRLIRALGYDPGDGVVRRRSCTTPQARRSNA
jgi:selenocysteine lyase/cysteine desulfurase